MTEIRYMHMLNCQSILKNKINRVLTWAFQCVGSTCFTHACQGRVTHTCHSIQEAKAEKYELGAT